MASKKTKKPEQAKRVYMSASLITVGDHVIRPGDIVDGLSDADEKMYLDAGMIYPLERFIHEKEDAPENTDNASEDSGNTEGSEEDSKDVEEDKEAGEA